MNLDTQLIVVPVIVALVEVGKRLGISSRLAPLLALALGIGGFYIGQVDTVMNGILFGLTASGLYSGVRATVS